MKKTSRVVAASLTIFALLGLTGCSEVIASAAVIDNDSAVFVLEQNVSPEAMKTLAALPQEELRGISGAPDAENTSIPNLTGVWKQTNGAENEIEISLTSVKVYDITGDRKKLIWSGSYVPPQYPTRIHDWQSEPDQDNPGLIEKLTLPFSYTDGELFYIATDQDGASKAMFFQQENPPVEEKPVTVPETSNGPLSQAELCEYLEASSEKSELAIEGSERQVTCDENGFKAVTSYDITYAFGGITAIGDHELSAQERRDLPFRFGVDPVYKDVVFQHDILGLNDPEVVKNVQDWKKYVTNYSVNVSFPGDVTGFSGEGVQNTPQSVSWDYNAIADSVTNGKYTLSAAGRADYKVNPLPIIMTVVGIIFLLVLLVYFMWKRFTPKVIIVLSYCLAIFGPFGLALALVAREKSRNNADGAFQAAVAIWVTSAIFVFEVLVIALLAVLTPQVITEVLAAMGLATSGA